LLDTLEEKFVVPRVYLLQQLHCNVVKNIFLSS